MERKLKKKHFILFISILTIVISIISITSIVVIHNNQNVDIVGDNKAIETSETPVQTIEISDSNFIGGGFSIGADTIANIKNCTFTNLSTSFEVLGTVNFVDSTLTRTDDSTIDGFYVRTGELNLLGNSQITKHKGLAVYVRRGTLNLGYYTDSSDTSAHEFDQFTGSISENNKGVYAYMGSICIYAGCISDNTTRGVELYEDSDLFMDGTGTISGNQIGVKVDDLEFVDVGVYDGTGSNFHFKGGTISGNTNTNGNGGGVYVGLGGSLSMEESSGDYTPVITGNSAKLGGGVYVAKDAFSTTTGTFTASNGEISSNTATENGGGVYTLATVSVGAVTISGNSAVDGAGIYLANNDTTYFSDYGTISQNTASGNGGGIYCAGTSVVDIKMMTISGNSAVNGGGIYLPSGTTGRLYDVTISGNTVTTYGGGVYANNATLTISGAEIKSNTATSLGGGVYNVGGTTSFNSGKIESNSAANGAGIYLMSGTLNVTGGSLSSNTASNYGGACMANGGTINVSGGTFTSNSASTSGASFYSSSSDVIYTFAGASEYVIPEANISNTSISITGSDVGFTDSTFTNLSSALAVSGTATFSNSTITRDDGGSVVGISVAENGNVSLSGSSISNTGSTGISASGSTTISLDNSSISGTTSYGINSSTGTLSITNNSSITMSNSNGSGIMSSATTATISDSTITGVSNASYAMNIAGSGTWNIVNTNISTFKYGIYNVWSDPTINLLGTTSISGCTTLGVYILSGCGAVCNLGYSGTSSYDQYSGSISGNTAGIECGYAELNIYSGNVLDNAQYAVNIANSTVSMSGGTLGATSNSTAKTLKGVNIASSSTFNMSGGTITKAYNAGGNGAGIYVSTGCTLNMTGGTVSNNKAANGAGIYVCADAVISSLTGTITGNAATSYGGGIYFVGKSSNSTYSATVGGTVSSNTAPNGAGVFAQAMSLTVSGSMSSNTATNQGGGVYFGNPSGTTLSGTLTIASGSNLTKNSAANGGAIYARWVTMNVTGGTIGSSGNANTASSQGGGVFITNSTFSMTGGTIAYNTASVNGGGIYFGSSNTATISGGTIGNNSAVNGGGLYIAYSNNSELVTLSGGTISGNSATAGGGVYVSQSSSTKLGYFKVTSGSIVSNTATENGGGIYSKGSLTLSGGNVGASGKANTAENGGGVYATTSMTMDSTNARVQYNTASADGGGVYSTSTVTISAGYVYSNTASGNGGGVRTPRFVSTSTSSVNITYNTAKNGGGLFIINGSNSIDCDIRNYSKYISFNTATNDGGGIYLAGSTLNLAGSNRDNNIKLRNNSAGNKGGAIFAGTSDGTSGSTLTIVGAYIYGNYAVKSGGGLVIYKSTVVFGNYTTIQSNYVNATSGSVSGGGIIVDSSSASFDYGVHVYDNYITGKYSYAGGGGLYLEGASTTCSLDGVEFISNYIAASTSSSYFSAGGNIFVNSDVSSFKTVTNEVLIEGDGSTTQAKIGGGLFIHTIEYNYNQYSTIELNYSLFNIKFNDCVADYGAAIASVGSFELQGATISSCTATSGIGDAIFLAGVLYLDQNNSIEGDVAIASNETNGTHRDDYSATILGSSVKIPYRTGSIVCLSAQSSTIALTFCDFTVSLTGSITVTNSSTNCDKFYVQGEVLIYSGTNTFITNYFTLPSGYAWTEHYDDNDSFDGFTLIK